MPGKLAATPSGYYRLLNLTKSGDVLNIYVRPLAGILEGKKLDQQTVTVGYWIRKDTPAGPTLYGPIAFFSPTKKLPVPSPMPVRTWRRFWRVSGLTVAPVIAKYKRVQEPKRTYLELMFRNKIRAGQYDRVEER